MLVIIMSFNISVHRKVQMVGIFQRGLCVPLIVAYHVFLKKKNNNNNKILVYGKKINMWQTYNNQNLIYEKKN